MIEMEDAMEIGRRLELQSKLLSTQVSDTKIAYNFWTQLLDAFAGPLAMNHYHSSYATLQGASAF